MVTMAWAFCRVWENPLDVILPYKPRWSQKFWFRTLPLTDCNSVGLKAPPSCGQPSCREDSDACYLRDDDTFTPSRLGKQPEK